MRQMKFTQNLARAAMLLLLAVLTSVGAWADEAEDLSTPLTFEATTAGVTVTFSIDTGTAANGVEYSTDGNNWSTYTSGTDITLANAGDKVQFRGENASYSNGDNYSRIQCSGDCYIYGNIMSLITKTDFATAKTLTGNYTFYGLFSENSHIVNHESKKLMLPATTLAYECYEYMFYKCENLKNVPALPATTLAGYCYYAMFEYCTSLENVPTDLLPATTLAYGCYEYMFYGCESLKNAPALPATTLADYCYEGMFCYCYSLENVPTDLLPATTLAYGCYVYMFYDCESLKNAPALPATTLADYCYYEMFYGCESLKNAPALPATTLADYCYYEMFCYCYELENAPVLPATTLAGYCYYAMFAYCTSLENAPALPATKLEYECYEYMFYDCEKINSIVCMATNISAYDCTYDWVDGVAEHGTIYIAKGMREEWENNDSDSGIPSGWTVVECEAASVAAGSFSTLYYDEDMSLAVAEPDLTFYTVKSVGADKVVLQKITQPVIPADTPFLVYNANENVPAQFMLQPVEPVQQPQPLQVDPAFKGTATEKVFSDAEVAAADHYLLYNNAFLLVRGAGTVAAHRCWLELASNSAARELNIVFDETTGVNEVIEVNEVSDDTLYDLNGRKMVHGTLSNGTLPKGLYIQNGKKIIVK